MRRAHKMSKYHHLLYDLKNKITIVVMAEMLAACEETNPYRPPRYSLPSGFWTVFTRSAISKLCVGLNLKNTFLNPCTDIKSLKATAAAIISKKKRANFQPDFLNAKTKKNTWTGIHSQVVLTYHMTVSIKSL